MTNGRRIVVVPRNNPVNAYTMGGIARDAGLTVDQFRELLQLQFSTLTPFQKAMKPWTCFAASFVSG